MSWSGCFGKLLLLLVMLLVCAGCGRAPMVQKSEIVMDTVAQLTAEGPEAEAAVQESFGRLQELEGLLSNYEEGSDAARLRDSAGSGAWVKVSPEMYHLLEISQRYSQLTDGAWDITAAPLIKLWGIGTDKARVPEASEIEQVRGKVDWHKLELDGRDSARLLVPGMELDMGGIAKGYALDEVRKIYAKHGIEKGLINLGSSSIYALGVNGEGKPWRIGLRHPRREEGFLATAEISQQALSTSGDYERFFVAEGIRYHHIIDPRTGCPAWSGREITPEKRPVSVLALVDGNDSDCGLKADILTTALFVLGREKGMELLESLRGAGVQGGMATEDGRWQGTYVLTDFRDF